MFTDIFFSAKKLSDNVKRSGFPGALYTGFIVDNRCFSCAIRIFITIAMLQSRFMGFRTKSFGDLYYDVY